MSDSFIESIISSTHESENTEIEQMIAREFHGMEAVAVDSMEDNFAEPVSASENEGDN